MHPQSSWFFSQGLLLFPPALAVPGRAPSGALRGDRPHRLLFPAFQLQPLCSPEGPLVPLKSLKPLSQSSLFPSWRQSLCHLWLQPECPGLSV